MSLLTLLWCTFAYCSQKKLSHLNKTKSKMLKPSSFSCFQASTGSLLSSTSSGDLSPTTLSALTLQAGHFWWCLLMPSCYSISTHTYLATSLYLCLYVFKKSVKHVCRHETFDLIICFVKICLIKKCFFVWLKHFVCLTQNYLSKQAILWSVWLRWPITSIPLHSSPHDPQEPEYITMTQLWVNNRSWGKRILVQAIKVCNMSH